MSQHTQFRYPTPKTMRWKYVIDRSGSKRLTFSSCIIQKGAQTVTVLGTCVYVNYEEKAHTRAHIHTQIRKEMHTYMDTENRKTGRTQSYIDGIGVLNQCVCGWVGVGCRLLGGTYPIQGLDVVQRVLGAQGGLSCIVGDKTAPCKRKWNNRIQIEYISNESIDSSTERMNTEQTLYINCTIYIYIYILIGCIRYYLLGTNTKLSSYFDNYLLVAIYNASGNRLIGS